MRLLSIQAIRNRNRKQILPGAETEILRSKAIFEKIEACRNVEKA